MKNILRLVNKNGGITLSNNLVIKDYNKGYMVSLYGFECITIEVNFIDTLKAKIKELKDFCNWSNDSLDKIDLGIWKDGDKYYIDFSIKIDDLEHAKYFGTMNKQLAIFDNKTKEVISL
jgi:hypothetical protein